MIIKQFSTGLTFAGTVVSHKPNSIELRGTKGGVLVVMEFQLNDITIVKCSAEEIDWSNFAFPITDDFTVGEYLQYDKQRIPQSAAVKQNSLRVLQELQKLRDEWGAPLRITSGYRPTAINRAVGGVRGSQHTRGTAVDIQDIAGRHLEFEKFCLTHWSDAVGKGANSKNPKNFTHLDVRFGGGFRPGAKPQITWYY